MAQGERGTVGNGNVTVKAAVEAYTVRRLAGRDLAPSTRVREEWAMAYIVAKLGGRRLRGLTVAHIETALDQLAAAGLARESLVKIRGTLGRVLDDAIRRGDADRNLAKLAELPADARRTPVRRSLTPDEARRFIEACEGARHGALLVFMIGTAVRPGEAAGLRWSAVDLDAGAVAINSARRTDARGRVEVVDDLKTRGSRRAFVVPSWVVDSLRHHRKAQAAERLAAPIYQDQGLVFATSVGTPLSGPGMRKALEAIAAKAGVGAVSPNLLRHTAASLLVDSGMYLSDVADQLGHSTTRMLEMTYRHAVRPSMWASPRRADGWL